MRFIDIRKVYVPAEWDSEAKQILKKLRNMTAKERSEAWKKDEYQLWPITKALLAGLSFNKCWYSEELVTGAKGDVDHFRPKGTLLDVVPKHEGYWWAALDQANFRFSCQICNRLYTDELTQQVMGKGAYFPLPAKGFRARKESDSLKKEKNLLLDPTRKGDPDLLWFEESGKAVPSKTEKKDKAGYQRAKESIVRYHLNEKEILISRGLVCDEVKRDCEKLKRYEERLSKGEVEARRTVLELKVKLAGTIQPYARFSAAALAILKGYQSSPSVREVLSKNKKP
jgi:hypothetical protein